MCKIHLLIFCLKSEVLACKTIICFPSSALMIWIWNLNFQQFLCHVWSICTCSKKCYIFIFKHCCKNTQTHIQKTYRNTAVVHYLSFVRIQNQRLTAGGQSKRVALQPDRCLHATCSNLTRKLIVYYKLYY